jgi:hypothetical protein
MREPSTGHLFKKRSSKVQLSFIAEEIDRAAEDVAIGPHTKVASPLEYLMGSKNNQSSIINQRQSNYDILTV